MEPTSIALIGFGWRARFFARVADSLPQTFSIIGVVKPDRRGAEQIEREWGFPVFPTAQSLVSRQRPDFFVVSVPAPYAADVAIGLSELRVPILMETPPARDLDVLTRISTKLRGFPIQIAEQYVFQPYHAAVLALIHSGRIGQPTHANVSVAHGYHGASMIRHLLGTGMQACRLDARSFESPLVAGPTREGPPQEEKSGAVKQTIAIIEFEHASAVFDFTQQQYMSWIRDHRMLVRGPRGEVTNRDIRYLARFDAPIECSLVRHDAGRYGNLEGFFHKGFTLQDEWIYRNPFAPARLSDDEIAVATCMAKMADFAGGGAPFYTLDEACQDTYLSLLIQEAAESGKQVRATPQVWSQM